MRAVDTNILVRLVAQDDQEQFAATKRFIAGGAWVSALALVEMAWVLEAGYGRTPEQLVEAIESILDSETLVVQDPEAVSAALKLFRARPALGFIDCLMVELARKAGHLPLGTFDRALSRVEGTQKL